MMTASSAFQALSPSKRAGSFDLGDRGAAAISATAAFTGNESGLKKRRIAQPQHMMCATTPSPPLCSARARSSSSFSGGHRGPSEGDARRAATQLAAAEAAVVMARQHLDRMRISSRSRDGDGEFPGAASVPCGVCALRLRSDSQRALCELNIRSRVQHLEKQLEAAVLRASDGSDGGDGGDGGAACAPPLLRLGSVKYLRQLKAALLTKRTCPACRTRFDADALAEVLSRLDRASAGIRVDDIL